MVYPVKKTGGCKWCEVGECWGCKQSGKSKGKESGKSKGKGKNKSQGGGEDMLTAMLTAVLGGKGKGGDWGGNSWAKGAGQLPAKSGKKNKKQQQQEENPLRNGTRASDAKSKLSTGVMILKGSSTLKTDIVYTTEEEGGEVTTTVSITCLDDQLELKGSPVVGTTKANKKEAEQNAAEAALAKLQDAIDAKEPERLAKKEAKEEERKAMWASILEEKKRKAAEEKENKK